MGHSESESVPCSWPRLTCPPPRVMEGVVPGQMAPEPLTLGPGRPRWPLEPRSPFGPAGPCGETGRNEGHVRGPVPPTAASWSRPVSGGGGPGTLRPETPTPSLTLVPGGFCSGPGRFLGFAGTLRHWACQGLPAGAGRAERPLTGKPAYPGRPCGREGRVSSGRRVDAGCGSHGGRLPPTSGPGTLASALCRHRRNTEPRKEAKDNTLRRKSSSSGRIHKTAQN